MTLAAIDLWSTPRFAELLSVKAPGDASRFLSASSFAEFSETLLLENKRGFIIVGASQEMNQQ